MLIEVACVNRRITKEILSHWYRFLEWGQVLTQSISSLNEQNVTRYVCRSISLMMQKDSKTVWIGLANGSSKLNVELVRCTCSNDRCNDQ